MRRRALLSTGVIVGDPLCFTAGQSGSTVALTTYGTLQQPHSFEYSYDGAYWASYTVGVALTLNVGSKVYFRGDNPILSESTTAFFFFVMTGSVAADGDVTSLLNGTGEAATVPANAFWYLFRDCTSLTTPPTLPATTVQTNGYGRMFSGCTSLTSSPALPATTIGQRAYQSMFSGCTSLASAPALPATTLSAQCYYYMFEGCAALATAPTLPASTVPANAYNSMFRNCTALTTAPALPATTIADNSYSSMFQGCSSLKVYSASGSGHTAAWRIPTAGAISASYNQQYMFDGTTGDYSSALSVTLNTTFYTQNTPV